MLPRLERAEAKRLRYIEKLDDSPYYLAAQVFNPACRTAFLKDDLGHISVAGEQKIYIVRKLWKRFRDKDLASTSVTQRAQQQKSSESDENLSAFHKARLQQKLKYTRPQSLDEFDNYISENPIPLDKTITSIQWWCSSFQRIRFPQLSQLALEVLSMPGMSDSPERVFSGARRRISWDRTKTSIQLLEASECSKNWMDEGIFNISL
jgi:hypothetical protein